MSDDSKSGITANSPKTYVDDLKNDLEQKKKALKAKLLDPNIPKNDKIAIRKELVSLEDDLKNKVKNSKYSLF